MTISWTVRQTASVSIVNTIKSSVAKLSTSERLQPLLQRVMPPVDRFFNTMTGGRFHPTDAILPVLVLHHTGRKSGRARTTPLAYLHDDDRYLVVGSNWGGLNHPAWALNICDDPNVEVDVKGHRFPAVAHRLEGEERAAAWAKMRILWPSFDSYEVSAEDREIRVFALVPR